MGGLPPSSFGAAPLSPLSPQLCHRQARSPEIYFRHDNVMKTRSTLLAIFC